jgi:peptidoglycan hydrolase-like protein with peptidoglycan-binding domain
MLKSKRLSRQPQFLNATRDAPLARGSQGLGVAALQDLLVDLGLRLPKSFARGRADGIFGPETEAAVKQFQRRSDLRPDGMVGPLTLGVLDVLILNNPLFLELIDWAAQKASMLQERSLPIARRRCAYW